LGGDGCLGLVGGELGVMRPERRLVRYGETVSAVLVNVGFLAMIQEDLAARNAESSEIAE